MGKKRREVILPPPPPYSVLSTTSLVEISFSHQPPSALKRQDGGNTSCLEKRSLAKNTPALRVIIEGFVISGLHCILNTYLRMIVEVLSHKVPEKIQNNYPNLGT